MAPHPAATLYMGKVSTGPPGDQGPWTAPLPWQGEVTSAASPKGCGRSVEVRRSWHAWNMFS